MASELAWPQSSGLPCLGSYALTLQVISTQAEENRWAQGLFCSWYGTSCHETQSTFNKAILSFPRRLRACVKAGGGHFEHTLKCTTCQILVSVITVNVSWQWKLQVVVDYSVQNWKYGIEYLYSHNFGEKWNIFLNFTEFLQDLSHINKKIWL